MHCTFIFHIILNNVSWPDVYVWGTYPALGIYFKNTWYPGVKITSNNSFHGFMVSMSHKESASYEPISHIHNSWISAFYSRHPCSISLRKLSFANQLTGTAVFKNTRYPAVESLPGISRKITRRCSEESLRLKTQESTDRRSSARD